MTSPPLTGPSKKRAAWLRTLLWLTTGALALLIVSYFVVTSGAFFKGVILPKVGQAMNASVTAADAAIHPFSSISIKGLTVRTADPEPVATVDEIRLHYSLSAIIGGTLKVDELALVNPRIRVQQNADGTSNLDPLTRGQPGRQPSRSQPQPGPGATPQVDVGRIAIENGSIQVIQKAGDGGESRLTVERLNFFLNNIRNSQTATLKINGASQYASTTSNSTGSAQIELATDLSLGLTPSLELATAKGSMTISIGAATGQLAKLAGIRTVLDCDVTPTELKQLSLRASNGPALLSELTIQGPFNPTTKEGTLDLALNGLNLADWQALMPGLEPVGTVSAKGRLALRHSGQEAGFDFQTTLQDLGARLGTNRVSHLGLLMTAAGHVTNSVQPTSSRLALNRAEIVLTHESQPAARLTAVGTVASSAAGDGGAALELGGDLQLARLTRIVPQPEVQLEAGSARLVGLRLEQLGHRQSLSGQLILTNLTGHLAGTHLTNVALGATCDLTATDGKVIDLRRVALHLAETSRTRSNEVNLAGRIDLTQTNAIDGRLTLSADALDVTPYYDLFASQPAATPREPGVKTPTTPPSPPSTNAPVEPDPVHLPVRQLAVDTRIGHLWLREVEATNVQASVKIEASRVTIRPLALAMNGAPLGGDVDVDLGVKGWRYAIRATAGGLPIAPLADSFVPEYRGRAKGDLWADVKIDGAGVTSPSLRQNLAGNVALSFTNADIQIVGPRLKGFLTPIANGINAPGLVGSPLKWVAFGASIGSGRLGLSQLALVSPAFAAATKGEITLAENLGASKLGSWPMAFQLERTLAERLRLAPKDTPTNALLVPLPQFIKVAGSINDPKPDLDLKALAGAALLKYADKIPGVDEKTSGLLKSAAGFLTRSPAGTTNPPAGTNSSTTTTNISGGLLDLFKRPKSK